MSDKNYMQQSRMYQFRDGFPISSQDVNDIFDSYFYDIFSILDTDIPKDDPIYTLLLHAINDIDGLLHNRKDKSILDTKYDHTPNWRKI